VGGQPGVAEHQPWRGGVRLELVVGEAVEPDAALARIAADLPLVQVRREAGEQVQPGGDPFDLGLWQVPGQRGGPDSPRGCGAGAAAALRC
jgi:hypothetical protein